MTSALTTVLIVAGIAVCITGIWTLVKVGAAADSVRALSSDLEERVPPLLDKADVTVDALNAELLRVDLIVTQVEEVTDRVSSASNAVHTIVTAPHEIVADLSEKLRRSLKARRQHHDRAVPHQLVSAEEPPAGPEEASDIPEDPWETTESP